MVLALVLGLLAKPMVVTLPLVLLLLDYWPLGRVGAGEDGRPAWKVYWQLVREKIPLFAVTALACMITVMAQKASGAMMPLTIRPFGPRIANALVAYLNYAVKMFWPFPMSFFYPLAPVP